MKKKSIITTLCMLALSVIMVFAFAACNGDNAQATVESVALDKTEITLAPGDSQRLTATVKMSDGSEGDEEVVWSTSDNSKVGVIKGVVSAKAPGTATVTAKVGDKSATCTVTVENIVVELNKTTLAMERYSEQQLTAAVKKDGVATSEKIEWESSAATIVSVDENGNLKALKEGEADITATRKGANQKAVCKVTVSWTKPQGYEEIAYYEQNKVPAGKWGYWNDPANYVGGTSEMIDAYYQNSEGSEAGKVNFMYTIKSRQEGGQNLPAIIQITYRNANGDSAGTLETNHKYKMTCEITSSAAGTVLYNTVGLSADDQPKAELEAGKATKLEATFRHGDWGTIYPEGVYDNVESAGYFLLGLVGDLDETVIVSIDKFKWEDLGEAEEKTVKPDFSVKLPDLTDTQAVALQIATQDERYTITDNGEGKSYTVAYTGMQDNTYQNIAVDLPEGVDVKACNTFAVTITNNGTTSMQIRFDIQGTNKVGNSQDCTVKSVASGDKQPQTNAEYGGTSLTVEAGATVTLYLTYASDGEKGDPTAILIYFDSLYFAPEDSRAERSGNVTISDFKFAKVEAAE